MITLLDVSVLIALVDAGHIHHQAATGFFRKAQPLGWATCPLTENGFLRILGRPDGGLAANSTSVARTLLHGMLAKPGHHFWPDDVSLMDVRIFPSLPGSRHLTDLYLLALAVRHGGRFATFDKHMEASLIPGGPAAYHLISPA
ncbi:MAG: PIN domain-containing protein [Verrucomicrobiales bacterium]|nr:PIN domain-containing protein [Verrucomicrobiales bacterium]